MYNLSPCYFVFLLIPCLSYGQSFQLQGQVVNSKQQPVEFMDVYLTSSTNSNTPHAYTDSLGNFTLQVLHGNYTLLLIEFGKQKYSQDLVVAQDMNLGKIQVDEGVLLDSITITAKKKLIERKVDRLVFNVENSVMSQGVNVIDLLKSTPLVNVQNENVSIVGKGNVVVMINDKVLNITQNDLFNYLQSLTSNDVKNIEVITTPSSKYEAQGNSGIINIVLKKNQSKGWNGNLTSFYQKNEYGGFGVHGTINYKSKKLSISLKLRQSNNNYKPYGTRNLLGENYSIYTNEKRKDQKNIFGGNYSMNYQIDDKQDIGLLYDLTSNNTKMNAFGTSIYQHLNLNDSILYTNQKQIWKTRMHIVNLYYDYKFDSIGNKMSLGINYLSNIPNKINDFSTMNKTSLDQVVMRNNSLMKYSILSGQLDIVLPAFYGMIEFGTKGSLFKNASNVSYFNVDKSSFILDNEKSNQFKYEEKNYAIYFSYQKDISDKWSVKSGVRFEYTVLNNNAIGEEDNTMSKDKYGEFFPTVYLSYSPNTSHVVSLNFSRRIERPSFQELNPFRWYTNPYTYFSGTPSLLPVFSNNIELSYTLYSVLNATLFYQYDKNGTSNIANVIDGQYVNIIKNSFNENMVGLQLSYNDNLFNRWETSINVIGYYDKTTSIIKESEGLSVYALSYSSSNTFTLNKDKTYSLMVNFWHSLPYTYSNIKIEKQMSFDIGLKLLLNKRKLTTSLLVEDLFKTSNSNGFSYNSGYRSEFTNFFDSRKLVVSINYSFGNDKVKNKFIQFDEQNRAQ
ncbi:outer membrane beta-barrel family protein [Myroides odoratus]|uniref:TonB-dependent receptor n=1 Tax=Myroides odoratus TaxID=256 RepID=A0A9Q7ECS9_MYROD|nr:outer membrane beta-barrel family protein [Myroides odoratus]EHQ40979.1 TonB-dependent receptor [Myroides odoratus DSM 2801]EKB08389.1 hypothetical protein HMPREF9716_01208 [Myroides odoratus CIP 103059]QQU01925.1 TonB-dependent receptor [Myroides odoratus]WQD55784.1 TonB-dependent receptor [Myroides odoratus]STZ32013.1 Uncharacterised protein [Myroides odoratus]